MLSIPPIDRQLKRLAKKFPSLKTEYAKLVKCLENNPLQGKPLGNHCYKIRWQLPLKGKVNPAAQELLSIFNMLIILYFFSLSMISQSKKIFPIKSSNTYYRSLNKRTINISFASLYVTINSLFCVYICSSLPCQPTTSSRGLLL